MSAVSWYTIPGGSLINLDGDLVAAYWSPSSNRIVVASDFVLQGVTIRHEMLHALLERTGHSRSQFLERCGGVVSCPVQCVSDAGALPPLDPSTPRVTPDGLDIGVEMQPANPSPREEDGVFTVIVTARNPATHSVAVPLVAGPAELESFTLELQGTSKSFSSGTLLLDDGVTRFGPGETKRQYFDLRISGAIGPANLPPGTYAVKAGFGNHKVSSAPIVLPP
jgi:hypothetical protein